MLQVFRGAQGLRHWPGWGFVVEGFGGVEFRDVRLMVSRVEDFRNHGLGGCLGLCFRVS